MIQWLEIVGYNGWRKQWEFTLAEGFDGMFEVFANDNLSENYHWFENNEWNMENK